MPPTRYQFNEPGNLYAANDRIDVLVDETQDIESQLGNPDKRNTRTGERMTDMNYRIWKYQAIRALAIKRAEQRYLKRWVMTYHIKKRTEVLETLQGDPVMSLLSGLYVVVNKWIRDGSVLAHPIPESDQELPNIIQQYLVDPKNTK